MQVSSRIREEFSFIRGNLLVLIVSWVLMNFASGIPSTYYSLYILELEGTPFIIGILGFVSWLVLASVQFLGGYLADKHGRRWLIVVMTFGVALSNIFFAIAPVWYFILVGTVIESLCLIYQPALGAITADSIPPKRRGMGFSTIMFINNFAELMSPIIAGLLYLRFGLLLGMRIGYLIVTVAYLAAALVRLKLTETLPIEKAEKITLNKILKVYPKTVKESINVWKHLPSSMLILFITNAISSFTFALSMPYLVVYATEILHVEELEWAIIMTWLTAVMILSALPSGKIVDKIGRKKPLLISWVFLALFLWLFVHGDPTRLFASFLFFGVSNSLFSAAYFALEADLVPRKMRGKEAGCSQFIVYVLMAVGELSGGFFYQYISSGFPFLLALLVVLPCTLLTFFHVHEPQKRES